MVAFGDQFEFVDDYFSNFQAGIEMHLDQVCLTILYLFGL